MSTLSHERGSTSEVIKRVILHNEGDHYELYEGNTSNVAKRLSLKGCQCMIWLLCWVATLNLGNTYSYDDVKLNLCSTEVDVTCSTYTQAEIKHTNTETSTSIRASYLCTWPSYGPFKWCKPCPPLVYVTLTLRELEPNMFCVPKLLHIMFQHFEVYTLYRWLLAFASKLILHMIIK